MASKKKGSTKKPTTAPAKPAKPAKSTTGSKPPLRSIPGGKGKAAAPAAEKKPRKVKAPKNASPKQKQRAELVNFKARELASKAKAGDSEALQKLTDVVVSYESLTGAEHTRKKTLKKWKEKVGGLEASFQNKIEEAHPPGAKESDHSKKLRRVEVAWAEWQEGKAALKEADSVCKAEIKKHRKALNKAMENSAQLTMEKQWSGQGEAKDESADDGEGPDEPSETEADGADGYEDDLEDDDGDPLDDADELDEDGGEPEGEGAATF